MEVKKYLFEEWRDIKGYEGLYQVSNIGRVRSLPNRGTPGRFNNGKIRDLQKRGRYLAVRLSKNGDGGKYYSVHRLVAEAFIPNPNNLPCVDHIDTNCYNNKVSNLRWVSYSDNSRNPLTIKHCIENRDAKGGKRASQTTYVYKNGALVKKCKSQNEAAAFTGVSRRKIWHCLNGLNETPKGYTFSKTPLN